jgi:regulator of protease activity HflC (stomatin/prohibitin superfamily)
MPVLVIAIVHCLLLCWPTAIWAQSRGHLGVFIQNAPRLPEGAGAPSGEGVLIRGVMRHGPAEQSGIRRGDIILKFGGEPVGQVEDLQRLLRKVPLGDTVEIEILRRDETLIIPVQIGPTPAPLPPSLPPAALPMLLQQDELFWVVVAAVGVSLLLVYLASAQPWRRWRPRRAASLMAQARRMRVSNHQVFFVLGGLLLAIMGWASLTVIKAGHRGVVFHLFQGVQGETLTEGVHFLLPVLNRVTVYDIRSRLYHVHNLTPSPSPSPPPRTPSPSPDQRSSRSALDQRSSRPATDHLLWTPTADGLKVGLDFSVRYRLDPSRLPELHRHVGPDFETKLVHPIVWNVTRLVASEYSLLDIYGKRRQEMQQQASGRVQALLARDGLISEDFLLREVVYTPEFEKTLVNKMVAEQKVQESAYEVEQAALRAQAGVIEAQGEAQALDLVNRAIEEHPIVLQYLWIKSLPEQVRVMVVPKRSEKPVPRTKPAFPEAQHIPTARDEDG